MTVAAIRKPLIDVEEQPQFLRLENISWDLYLRLASRHQRNRISLFSPSPCTQGEGWGEGSFVFGGRMGLP